MTYQAARIEAQGEAIFAITREREAQDREFGAQIHDPAYWYAIMGKQFGQLATRIIQHKWNTDGRAKEAARHNMYQEAKQVAACALALMEAISLEELPEQITTAVPADARQRATAMGVGDEALRYDEEPAPKGTEDVQLPGGYLDALAKEPKGFA
jgi:hypothetical protein